MKKTNSKQYFSPEVQLMPVRVCDVITVSGLGGNEVIELNEHELIETE